MDGEGSIWSWALWSAVVAIFLVWGSGSVSGQQVRSLVNDETSADNRQRAIVCGFWVMLASAAVCFGLTFIKQYGPEQAIQVIITSGVSAALLNFGAAERRALPS